ncbi:MAG TPA: acyl-CoA dehydrogenase family protein, partial [Pyrinomonadaceae bacterium]|nr:acyl-CoA dehydrogenase family protein [Pyrinomonadaceae bacterium]
SEAGELDEHDAWLLRILTPVMKLITAKQAVSVASEVLESFGGAGYVEDTGLPVLLRDSQVLPIWEGTTNVLALDTLRALGATQSIAPLLATVERLFESLHDANLVALSRVAVAALNHAETWLRDAQAAADRSSVEAGARRFALTLGRAIELALLIRQAQWLQDHDEDTQTTASARRFAQCGVDLIFDHS